MIDVVIPTYNRLWSLPRVLEFYLARNEVGRVVVVDDASTDGTADWIRGTAAREPRLVPVWHDQNRGSAAARNTGARVTDASLVFFADDDMLFTPSDGLSFMVRELNTQGADIAAPLHIVPEFPPITTLPPVIETVVDPPPGIFDPATLELLSRKSLARRGFPRSFPTPLACGLMLMRRSVLAAVRYDEGLGSTGYRDETDFQLTALKAGFRLIACARPVLIDLARRGNAGGNRASTRAAEYERIAHRNNWRVLRRHRRTISEQVGIRAPIVYLHGRFVAKRVLMRVRYRVACVLRRWGILPRQP